MKAIAVLLSAVVSLSVLADEPPAVSGTLSAPVRIDANPVASLLWRTVREDQVRLWWENPALATSARLTIAGIKKTTTVELGSGVDEYLWTLPALSVDKDEDVYTVRLEFLNGDAVLADETLTATGIGRVRGVGRDAVTRVYGDGVANSRWGKCPSGKAVVPVWDSTTSGLKVNDQSVALPVIPGWFGCLLSFGETTTLALTTSAGEFSAGVSGVADGIIVFFR